MQGRAFGKMVRGKIVKKKSKGFGKIERKKETKERLKKKKRKEGRMGEERQKWINEEFD